MNRFVRNKDGAEVMTYDRNWNAHPEYCRVTPDFSLADPIPEPVGYEHMLQVAEKLASKFPIVRVDLYNLNGKIYFGEMTFTSYGAIMDFYTDKFLRKCGSLIELPKATKQFAHCPREQFEVCIKERPGLDIDQVIVDKAYLDARHKFVHIDGLVDDTYKWQYPNFKLDDDGYIKQNYSIMKSAFLSIKSLADEFEKKMALKNYFPQTEYR